MDKIIHQSLADLPWLEHARDKLIYVVGGTWRALAKLHMEYSGYGLEVLHQYDVRPKEIAAFFKFMAKGRTTRAAYHLACFRQSPRSIASCFVDFANSD